jgi:hypothetical protein
MLRMESHAGSLLGTQLPYTLYSPDYTGQISMTDMDFTTPPGRSYRCG